ncbi:hypothetical protein BOTBODRAFT_169704 [Botryobasidium botryosum FD-172 SS1]|uniref:Protein kinase domain-containing protein n=1 Tax=Botryobasidium botryosum (strain FD-172 SS1) TaxID=930990 RepID=A0A067N248_BOTB1|nr:hypothetical protein BOTBODRAFT_169704 [Botryobasidium botryosum FD-172 SS1]
MGDLRLSPMHPAAAMTSEVAPAIVVSHLAKRKDRSLSPLPGKHTLRGLAGNKAGRQNGSQMSTNGLVPRASLTSDFDNNSAPQVTSTNGDSFFAAPAVPSRFAHAHAELISASSSSSVVVPSSITFAASDHSHGAVAHTASGVPSGPKSLQSPPISALRPAEHRSPVLPSNPLPHKPSWQSKSSTGAKVNQGSALVKQFFPGDDDDGDSEGPSTSKGTLGAPTRLSQPSEVSTKASQPAPQANTLSRTSSYSSSTPAPANHFIPARSSIPSSPPTYPLPPHIEEATRQTAPASSNHSAHVQAATAPPVVTHNQPPKASPNVAHGNGKSRSHPSQASTSRSEDVYQILTQVGEGTYGKVYKARDTVRSRNVALKRIRVEAERDGFPVTAMREIKLLQSLRHSNIINLYEMMVSKGAVYMVFEYMDHDLTGVLSQHQFTFAPAHLKSLCHQMLAGLAYLHHKGVIHRDMKGSNILLNNRGELKLGDFGLARFYQKRRRTDYTNRVITLWYRPPELLLGATEYGPEVDMWSAGCIMLELFTKKPIFQGNDEIHQLEVVYRLMGTPSADDWPGFNNLPWSELVKPKELSRARFREAFQKYLSPAALDLAAALLTYNPDKRVSAAQALEAPYFTSELPQAEQPTGLASLEGEWHELESKRARQKRRKTEGAS